MKRIITLFLALVMVLSLCACAGSGEGNNAETGGAAAPADGLQSG